MSAKTSHADTPEIRRERALKAVADCSPRTREIVAMMPFSDVTDKDREIAKKLGPIARRALEQHGKRLA